MVPLVLSRIVTLLAWLVPATTFAAMYPMPNPGNDLIGENFVVKLKAGDRLSTIGKQYGIGINEILSANPRLNPNKMRVGQRIIVPAQFILPKFRKGIIINTAELRLYYFTPDGRYVHTFPVGLGREEWRTPTAKTYVIKKEIDPIWNIPDSIREYMLEKTGKEPPKFVLPGPKNPLGPFAMYLQKTGYLIHGTNQPRSIGRYYSSGCIRMFNENVTQLFDMVAVKTPVYLIHHPNKVGWHNGWLYMESHKPILDYEEDTSEYNFLSKETAISFATEMRPSHVDWKRADIVEQQQKGIPQLIGFTPEVEKYAEYVE